MNLCILIPLITGIICAILGYLIGKAAAGNNTREIDEWKNKYSALEKDLADCNEKLNSKDQNTLNIIPFDATLAKSIFGKAVKENDLKIVEGIGPKIEQLFKDHGIATWKELSETSVHKCQDILDDGGEAYKIHSPITWPEQARLAYEGKWQRLHEWQDFLKGGRIK
ncbi:hypothetical protein SAMN04487906_1685 [Zhouia amylolytica]|uniref:LSU ribosomal protein L21p n=1 Tax=Zhouia amylolytica TaxID=376730 RepID=A0A1I6SLI1_9FLAO|nr:hypothetical protein [Zhouia amylolytica]SFS77789.1 hypothetical protein SAMN04487906_1685 [Zhouia amylolytica]